MLLIMLTSDELADTENGRFGWLDSVYATDRAVDIDDFVPDVEGILCPLLGIGSFFGESGLFSIGPIFGGDEFEVAFLEAPGADKDSSFQPEPASAVQPAVKTGDISNRTETILALAAEAHDLIVNARKSGSRMLAII